jgi:excisionase family DNA binding protein
MSEVDKLCASSLLGDALLAIMKQALREELLSAKIFQVNSDPLLTPEKLADRLNVPVSWVYEQSRQGKIPTHRLGRYIRFNLNEVLASQKKD